MYFPENKIYTIFLLTFYRGFFSCCSSSNKKKLRSTIIIIKVQADVQISNDKRGGEFSLRPPSNLITSILALSTLL